MKYFIIGLIEISSTPITRESSLKRMQEGNRDNDDICIQKEEKI